MNNTLVNGLRIIELLAHKHEPMSLSQIARALDLSKSNVHRLLKELSASAYVIRDQDSGAYTASIRLWELGSAVLSKLDLRRHAQHLMEALSQATGESVHLSVLDQNEVVYVHKVESQNPVRAYSQIGGRAPVYCVATGKAMLAFQSRKSILEMALHLTAHTANTITDAARLIEHLEQVRSQGYAVNAGEWREGVYGIGTPIFDSSGQAIAAIGLSGPAERFGHDQISRFAELLRQAAYDIMIKLGCYPPQNFFSRFGR
jgi:DNA-binding IclR family transcriptional regulator